VDEQWEYYTCLVDARMEKEGVKEYFNQKALDYKHAPRNTPFAMIPELNDYGKQGWELVHMQPVLTGKYLDIGFGGNAINWSSVYFCVFNRRLKA
jgi:hypothetical protein